MVATPYFTNGVADIGALTGPERFPLDTMAGAGPQQAFATATELKAFSAPARATQQVLTAGTLATYTTPAGVRQLRVRLWGSGGGGNGSQQGAAAGDGGDTIFNGVHAGGGKASGAGGSSATGTANFRLKGAPGGPPGSIVTSATNATGVGGPGGGLGGGPAGIGGPGTAGGANTGGGGSSGGIANAAFGASVLWPGGGEGECLELVINAPAASYIYTIGVGGLPVAPGAGGQPGGAGGSGLIVVDEIY